MNNLRFDASVFSILSRSIQKLVRVVGCTMGPSGKHVLIRNVSGAMIATRDGVTVARAYEPESKVEKIAVDLAKEAAIKTVEVAGDGTTAAIVLVAALLREALRYFVSPNVDVPAFLRGFDEAVIQVIRNLKRLSIPCQSTDMLFKIATISSNHDLAMAEMVAATVDRVGKSGLVVIEDGTTDETISEWKEGMCLDVGWVDPFFCSKTYDHARLNNCLVFIYDDDLGKLNDELLKVFDHGAVARQPMLILCNNVGGEVLQLLGSNQNKAMVTCPVRAPGFGPSRSELMQDVAVLTGGKVYTRDNMTVGILGWADQVLVTQRDTIISGGKGKRAAIEERARTINAQIETLTSEYAREQYRARAARLVSGTATIKIGASTDIERAEKKFRVEDAVHAAKSAVEEGVVPGGGVALYRAARAAHHLESKHVPEYKAGFDAVKRACRAPMRTIYRNAGLSDRIAHLEQVVDVWTGYDARTGDPIDFKASGILDTLKSQRAALEFAASVVRTVLTADVLVSIDHEATEEKNKWLKKNKIVPRNPKREIPEPARS